MPLQLRRGLESQRTSKTYASGELVYIENTGALYIGNGTTAGGVAVANLPETTIKDFTAGMFTGGSHTGITFTYNSTTKLINAAIDIELSNYQGTIVADGFRGSLFADDGSTIEGQPLVDAVSGKINLDGTVKGNVIPDTNIAYDLGSSSRRFRDLYLSGSSIKLGDATITATGSVVNLPAGSTINGVPLADFSGSSLLADIKGSVFAEDSGLVVDSIDRIFYGSVDAGGTMLEDGTLTASTFSLGTTGQSMDLTMNLSNNLQVRQIIDPSNPKGYVTISQSRGTLASPAAAQAGDEIGGVLIRAYTSSSTSAIAGIIGFVVDPTAVIAGGNFIKSQVVLSAATDIGQNEADAFILDSAGVATSNAFAATKYMQLPVYANDAARLEDIPTPAKGMMVFMTSGTVPNVSNKTVVYDGTAWTTV
jgi:hypothetical protein